MLTAVAPCPVHAGDRVTTPAATAGTVTAVWWVPPGPSPVNPSRMRPGRWLAIVDEDGADQPYAAAALRPDGLEAAP